MTTLFEAWKILGKDSCRAGATGGEHPA